MEKRSMRFIKSEIARLKAKQHPTLIKRIWYAKPIHKLRHFLKGNSHNFAIHNLNIERIQQDKNTLLLLRVEDTFLCTAQDAQVIKNSTTLQVVMFEENICYIFPVNELENVLPKLVKQKKFKVAICYGLLGNFANLKITKK